MSTLRLCRELYEKDVVDAAAAEYERLGLARIETSIEDEHFVCTFSACPYGGRQTMSEFENYLIDLANTVGRS